MREVILVEHGIVPVEVRTVIGGSFVGAESQILLGREYVGTLHHGLVSELARIHELQRAVLHAIGVLGGDEDHAARRARTVNGARRSILQHVDRLYILGKHRTDIAARHAVDNHQRTLTRVHRRHTAQLQRVARVGRVGARNGEVTHLAAQGVRHAGVARAGHELTARYRRNGRGDHLLLHRTVTHDHDLIHLGHALLQRHVDDRSAADRRFGAFVTDELEHQHVVRSGRQSIVAFGVGVGALKSVLNGHRDSCQRIALRIPDLTCHPTALSRSIGGEQSAYDHEHAH